MLVKLVSSAKNRSSTMANDIVHDLHDFMRQISVEMASEYQRIRRRSVEDPGTAGDQGEENWAAGGLATAHFHSRDQRQSYRFRRQYQPSG